MKREAPSYPDDLFPNLAKALKQTDLEFISRLKFSNWEEYIVRIEAPTLVIYADEELGGIVTHDSARKAATLNSRVTLAHIPGAGHSIRRQQFDQYITAVRNFLTQ